MIENVIPGADVIAGAGVFEQSDTVARKAEDNQPQDQGKEQAVGQGRLQAERS